jgi:hypothetical protein
MYFLAASSRIFRLAAPLPKYEWEWAVHSCHAQLFHWTARIFIHFNRISPSARKQIEKREEG